jgi:hypothetical protein
MRKHRLDIPLGYRKNGQPIFRIAGGSEPAGVEQSGGQSQGQQQVGTGQPQQQQQQQTGARPYDQYLQQLPETLRPQIEPIFQEWDRNTTQRFQELQGQISGYEPYQQVFDTYEPEAVQQAVGLAEALATPEGARQVLNSLAEALGVTIQDGSQGQNNNGVNGFDPYGGPDVFADPRFQELQQGMGSIAEMLQQQQQQQSEQQAYQETEQEWNGLKEQNKQLFVNPDGTENEDAQETVFALAMANGGDLKAAVQRYSQVVGKQAGIQNMPGQTAPLVGGGAQNGMPSGQLDMAKLTPEQRKQLAVQALQAANRQG